MFKLKMHIIKKMGGWLNIMNPQGNAKSNLTVHPYVLIYFTVNQIGRWNIPLFSCKEYRNSKSYITLVLLIVFFKPILHFLTKLVFICHRFYQFHSLALSKEKFCVWWICGYQGQRVVNIIYLWRWLWSNSLFTLNISLMSWLCCLR